nr:MAG TPA: hypothetical protein [Caudoviricetes sp.]
MKTIAQIAVANYTRLPSIVSIMERWAVIIA